MLSRILIIFTATIAIILVMIYFWCSSSSGSPEVPPDVGCKRRLGEIHYLMISYKEENGNYLPAVTLDSTKREMSWRYILAERRYIAAAGSGVISADYDLDSDQPWLSEYNLSVPAFHYLSCPVDANSDLGDEKKYETSYLMLLRPGKSIDDLLDTSVIIVESVGCGIHWLEPKDLDIETLRTAVSPFGKGLLNSYHKGYVNAVRKDGKVIRISKKWSKEKVIAILEGKK